MIDQNALKIFNKLYEETYDDVLKYVVCKCNKVNDIEDIMQNIYFYVYKNLLKGKELNKSYILGIAKNKVNDYYRFRYKDKIINLFNIDNNEEIEKPNEIDIEKSISLKVDMEKVWDYLKNKKIIIFKIFFLYYKCDLKIKEIANILNISEIMVKNYLYRTLHELKKYLESEGDNYE